MKVSEVASRQAWTCQPQTDLIRVGQMMREGDFGIAPVVDEKGRVVGVITDRDICLAVAARKGNLRDVTVRDVATTRVHSCRPEDDLVDALKVMKENRVRRLPVIDDTGTLRGVLSLDDVALVAGRDRTAKAPSFEDLGLTLQAISARGHRGREKVRRLTVPPLP